MNLAGRSAASPTTDLFGSYSFGGLVSGGTYTLTPSSSGHSLESYSVTFTELSSNQVVSFIAGPAAGFLPCSAALHLHG